MGHLACWYSLSSAGSLDTNLPLFHVSSISHFPSQVHRLSTLNTLLHSLMALGTFRFLLSHTQARGTLRLGRAGPSTVPLLTKHTIQLSLYFVAATLDGNGDILQKGLPRPHSRSGAQILFVLACSQPLWQCSTVLHTASKD